MSSSFFMSLERNFSLKLARVTSPGYFRSSKFSSDTSWSSASEEAKEWAAGSDCKKPAGRGFNQLAGGRAPDPGAEGEGPFRTTSTEAFSGVSCLLEAGGRHGKQHPEGLGCSLTSATAPELPRNEETRALPSTAASVPSAASGWRVTSNCPPWAAIYTPGCTPSAAPLGLGMRSVDSGTKEAFVEML